MVILLGEFLRGEGTLSSVLSVLGKDGESSSFLLPLSLFLPSVHLFYSLL